MGFRLPLLVIALSVPTAAAGAASVTVPMRAVIRQRHSYPELQRKPGALPVVPTSLRYAVTAGPLPQACDPGVCTAVIVNFE